MRYISVSKISNTGRVLRVHRLGGRMAECDGSEWNGYGLNVSEMYMIPTRRLFWVANTVWYASRLTPDRILSWGVGGLSPSIPLRYCEITSKPFVCYLRAHCVSIQFPIWIFTWKIVSQFVCRKSKALDSIGLELGLRTLEVVWCIRKGHCLQMHIRNVIRSPPKASRQVVASIE